MSDLRPRWGFAPHIERRLKRTRIALTIFNVISIALYVVCINYPVMTIADVRVEGPDEWCDDARAVVAPTGDSNLVRYDVQDAMMSLTDQFGPRADCGVRIMLPNRVDVRLTPTQPVLWTEWGDGVRGDGAIFEGLPDMPVAPVWRSTNGTSSSQRNLRSRVAVGTWTEVVCADPRYRAGISEWRRDDRDGWIMTAADGRTQIVLGWNNLTERAATVARILEHRDTTLTDGGVIDARFEGRIVVRPAGHQAAVDVPQNRHRSVPTMASRMPAAISRQGG